MGINLERNTTKGCEVRFSDAFADVGYVGGRGVNICVSYYRYG